MSKLVEIAKQVFDNKGKGNVRFVDNEEYNNFLNDIEKYPHAFVLACLMDKQMKAERAWEIPCKVYEELGNFDINYLAELPETTYIDLFLKNKYLLDF